MTDYSSSSRKSGGGWLRKVQLRPVRILSCDISELLEGRKNIFVAQSSASRCVWPAGLFASLLSARRHSGLRVNPAQTSGQPGFCFCFFRVEFLLGIVPEKLNIKCMIPYRSSGGGNLKISLKNQSNYKIYQSSSVCGWRCRCNSNLLLAKLCHPFERVDSSHFQCGRGAWEKWLWDSVWHLTYASRLTYKQITQNYLSFRLSRISQERIWIADGNLNSFAGECEEWLVKDKLHNKTHRIRKCGACLHGECGMYKESIHRTCYKNIINCVV